MLKIGDVAVVKITGERVVILTNVDDTFAVRRAQYGPNDNINEYVKTDFHPNELETPEEQVNRQVDARLLQMKGQERLSLAEMDLTEQLQARAEAKELEAAGGNTPVAKLAVVPKGKSVN